MILQTGEYGMCLLLRSSWFGRYKTGLLHYATVDQVDSQISMSCRADLQVSSISSVHSVED